MEVVGVEDENDPGVRVDYLDAYAGGICVRGAWLDSVCVLICSSVPARKLIDPRGAIAGGC